MLIDCIIHHQWKQLPHLLEMLATFLSMAAAFTLARVPKNKDRVT
jgi:hypothetical protein